MNEYQEIGKRIGRVLEEMEVTEVTVTIVSTFKQALQGRLDYEIMLNGTLLFHFKHIKDEQRENMFAGLVLVYSGDMTIRHNLPILTITREGDIRYRDTSIHSSQQFKSKVEENEYVKIINYEELFQLSPAVKERLRK